MKKIISIFTSTRADYGLFKPLIDELLKESSLDIKIVVTGSHLSREFGNTYKEIENDGFTIDEKIDILVYGDNPTSISKSMGLTLISFSDYFKRIKPDLLVVLGDRYETLAVVIAAANQGIPIAHLYGGESTEGAIDEAIRHSITKFSHIHFTSTETFRNRVIQLGEQPDTVFNVGALGIDNIVKETLYNRSELEGKLNLKADKKYALITYHPVTLDNNNKEQIMNLLNALEEFPELLLIFTKANADKGGNEINHIINEFVGEHSNAYLYDSLGRKLYLSTMKHAALIIGNSSSGIIEAPSFKVPTVNIGDRQKGRIFADSVINSTTQKEDIIKAIELALSNEFREKCLSTVNPYGDGNASIRIKEIIVKLLSNNSIKLKKSFYDIEVKYE
ncbi:MAG: UDP-N-acetylglucosamine 2-epimerase (hydrolyzing) [Tissierellales bacterium]|nr:UDP-N-acetylglucosamine 2-epimerase (hydrolyzing) [Tissierellales bacterium]